MGRIEAAFGEVTADAEATVKAAGDVARKARALAKASKEGNIQALRKAQADLRVELSRLTGEVDRASNAWPFSEGEETDYLAAGYAAELQAVAEDAGLELFEHDGDFIAYPALVRILPRERAVRVDRKRVLTLRPSHLVDVLLARQRKSSGFSSARFLETLHSVYGELLRETRKDRLIGESVIPLARIYKVVTALPGSSREYGRGDFARDIYTLDSEGPRETRSGRRVSFPTSTGTRRRSSDLFSFVGPNGEQVEYYGVKFDGAA